MKTQNITIALPVDLVRKVKALAARRGTSISAMLRDILVQQTRDDLAYKRAMEKFIARLERGFDSGLGPNQPAWTRDQLHERS